MNTSMRGYVACNDLSPWPISSRSFSHDFAIRLLKYVTFCHVRSTAPIVLDEIFPYLAQMITSMRRCVTCNDLWAWPVSLRLFSCDIAYFMDYIHMMQKCNPWGDNVSCSISRSIGLRSRSHRLFTFFAVGAGSIPVDHDLQFLVLKYSFNFTVVPYKCNISVWNWSNIMSIQSAPWILTA